MNNSDIMSVQTANSQTNLLITQLKMIRDRHILPANYAENILTTLYHLRGELQTLCAGGRYHD